MSWLIMGLTLPTPDWLGGDGIPKFVRAPANPIFDVLLVSWEGNTARHFAATTQQLNVSFVLREESENICMANINELSM